jgi:peptidoglycan hydrolase CwlO-like protein
MKKILATSLALLTTLLLTGCWNDITAETDKLKDDVTKAYDNLQQEVEDVTNKFIETKNKIEETTQDIQDAKEAIDEVFE